MWHLLRKNVYEIDFTIRLSIGLACTIHILCFIFFIGSHWLSRTTVVQVNRQSLGAHNVYIVIDPHVSTGSVSTGSALRPTVKKSSVHIAKPVQSVKKSTNRVEKNKTQPSVPLKQVEKKKELSKKNVPKKKVPTPAVVKKKQESVSKVQKPKDVTKKVTPIVPEPVLEQEKTKELAVVNAVPVDLIRQIDSSLMEGPVIIARSSQEAAALTIQLQLQEELLRVWHPPVGIEEGVSCRVRVILDATGVVQQIDMIEPSGTILFDVSARAAIQQAVWPRGMWGMTVELVLQ